MNDFLITIPSDFHSKTISDNKISNFKVDFDVPFDLSEEFSVGLVEIIYPTSVRNIPDDIKFSILFKYNDKYISIAKCKLKSGTYDTNEKFIHEIKEKVDEIQNDQEKHIISNLFFENIGFKNVTSIFTLPQIEFSNQRVKITLGDLKILNFERKKLYETKLFFKFDNYLRLMLGYEDNDVIFPEGVAKYPIDLFGNNHTLYLYTNIVKESFVGNKKSQILRVVPLDKIENDNKFMKSITFNPILFFPLRLHKFDLIEIQIRDSTGRMVIFESGRVVVTLMFKKKNS